MRKSWADQTKGIHLCKNIARAERERKVLWAVSFFILSLWFGIHENGEIKIFALSKTGFRLSPEFFQEKREKETINM